VFIVKKIFASILATVAILTLAGCAAPSTITVPASPSTPIALEPNEVGKHVTWILKSYGDVKNMTLVIPTGKDINLTFKGTLDGFTGSDGVNDYGGPCHIGNDGNIATSSITCRHKLVYPEVMPARFSNKHKPITIYCNKQKH
jgi:hypothetical protein